MSEVSQPRLVVVLTAALLAVSSAGVLVRGVDEASPVAIALWRCSGAAALVLPMVRELPGRGDLLRIGLGGVCLAAHFVTWFASLGKTTVLHSTLLVCLSPLWVGIAEATLRRQLPPPGVLLGAAAAVAGIGLMAGEGGGAVSAEGDALAVVAGWLGAAYLLLGRSVRERVALPTYAVGVTGAAACSLLPVAWLTHTPLWGFPPADALAIAGCVLVPQLVGHNGLNWALRHVPATTVSSLLLLEPVGAAILAALLLGEVPGPFAAAGALLAVLGVIASVRASASLR